MPAPLSRRAFLAGTGALAVAACTSDSKKASTSVSSASSSVPPFDLVSFSDSTAVTPGHPVRLTFGVANSEGVVLTNPPSSTLRFTVQSNGQDVVPPLTVSAHQQGLPRPYFPVVFTPPAAGVYDIATTVSSTPVSQPVQIPASTQVVSVGQPVPDIDTPTVANPQGVQLLCTHTPQCPLHDVSLKDLLAAKVPTALIFATPEFCQTAICGPVLDVVLGLVSQFPSIKFLHSEVYPSVAAAQATEPQVTAAMQAFGLTFEPALYLIGRDGVVSQRLDTIFDTAETANALTQFASQ